MLEGLEGGSGYIRVTVVKGSIPDRLLMLKEVARLEGIEFQGYLSDSGLEERIFKDWELAALRYSKLFTTVRNTPPNVLIEGPPGIGKTFLSLMLLASAVKGELYGYEVRYALYIAPNHALLNKIVRLLNEIWRRFGGRPKGFIIAYKSSARCKLNQPLVYKSRRLTGLPSTFCRFCPYKAREVSWKLLRILGREGIVVRSQYTGLNQVCLIPLVKRMLILLSAFGSFRKFGVFGFLVPAQLVLTPVVLSKWFSRDARDSPGLVIVDEADTIMTAPPSAEVHVPARLTDSEREILAREGMLDKYKELVKLLDSLKHGVQFGPWAGLVTYKVLYERLSGLFTRGEVQEVRRAGVEEAYYHDRTFRLVNLLDFISFVLGRGEEGLASCYVFIEKGEDGYTIRFMDYGLIGMFIFTPRGPTKCAMKLSFSATLLPRKYTEVPQFDTPLHYPEDYEIPTLIYDIDYVYDGLRIVVYPLSSVIARAKASFLSGRTFAPEEARELEKLMSRVTQFMSSNALHEDFIVSHPHVAFAVVESMVAGEVTEPKSKSLVYVNSKKQAKILVNLLAYMYRDFDPRVEYTRDGHRVKFKHGRTGLDTEIVVTWYRSRVTRGIDVFKDFDSSMAFFPAYEPPVVVNKLGFTMFRALAVTFQSLWRIVRSPYAHGKEIWISDIVYNALRDGALKDFTKFAEDVIFIDHRDYVELIDALLHLYGLPGLT